jgi:ATP-dependent DNA ligase
VTKDKSGPSLDTLVQSLSVGSVPERTEALGRFLDTLDISGRWALLKLVGGAPRVGVSARLAKTALAAAFGRDASEIEEIWHSLEPPYRALFDWLEGRAPRPDPGEKPVFRPLMLAHPITDEDLTKLDLQNFAAEWKWDGVRVQIAAAGATVRLYSRQG